MNEAKNPSAAKIEGTFNLAADSYDALVQWDIAARGTLDVARLEPGEVVLDVCCGSGSTALPAAEAVGPTGRVTGVDLSDEMLKLAKAKQLDLGLENVEFLRADMTALPYPSASFDAVICQLGLFFVQDLEAQVAHLWQLVRPGGRLVFTTFLGRANEPVASVFLDAVQTERGAAGAPPARGRTSDVASMRQLMRDAGTTTPTITVSENAVPLRTPDDFWRIATGSAYRGQLEEIGPEATARVHDRVVGWIRDQNVTALRWDLIFTVARKI